ncbi:MAG: glycosyltransferase family 2 protein, partial [Polyangiaceae bacterium]|nr:glycosyltransferase family 2 protein [Polyangiaceae bacterium]
MSEARAGVDETLRSSVVLAIASFRSDEAVLEILASVHSDGDHPFRSIVIVDSLSSGRIGDVIAEREYPRVEYRVFDKNIGAAGNLLERLRYAAEDGAQYVYALNHDAAVDVNAVRALVRFALERPRIGAVYPARRYIRKGGAIDTAGARRDVMGTLFARARDVGSGPLPVHWSSSNGALYALEPFRRGVVPWEGLFHGYEDLDFGWSLESHGYEQYILRNVVVADDYEYRRYALGPVGFYASEKPAWYAYYQARNLVLVARRHGRGGFGVAGRLAIEVGLVTLVRHEKSKRLSFLARGLFDAARGRLGKWTFPRE